MSSSGGENQNADESSAFFANNDASSYNTRYLKSIRNKERFQELHFFQCDEELVDELIPKKTGKGTLFPPIAYLGSAALLHEWRDMDEEEQLRVMEQEKLKAPSSAGGGGAPDARKGKRESSTVPVVGGSASGDCTSELKRTLANQEEGSSAVANPAAVAGPPAKVAKIDEREEYVVVAPSPTTDYPVRWGPSRKDVNADFRKDRVCRGITLGLLKRTFPNEQTKLKGFGILVGEAMKYKVEVYSKDLSWPFACDPRIVGCLVNKEGEDEIVLSWICVQLPETKDGETVCNEFKLDGIHFYHPTCNRSSTNLLCECCKSHVNEFVTLCGATSPS